MSIAIIKIDVRKVLPYYVPVLLLVIGFVLLWKTPLTTGDLMLNLILNLMACLQGMVIAWMLFHDSGGTAAFIFSRPLSRKRLFLTRWCCGILFQFMTILVVFAIISTGLRSWIQVLMDSPYQPMVKWYELSVLGSFALYSILGYQVVMFLRLRASIVSARPSNVARQLENCVGLRSVSTIFTGDIRKLPSAITLPNDLFCAGDNSGHIGIAPLLSNARKSRLKQLKDGEILCKTKVK